MKRTVCWDDMVMILGRHDNLHGISESFPQSGELIKDVVEDKVRTVDHHFLM